MACIIAAIEVEYETTCIDYTASSPIVSHQGTDVTDVETQENTLVVETPAGGGNDPGQVDTPQSTLNAVNPL